MATFTENFTGTNGDPWPSGWANDLPSGSGPVTTIQANRGRMSTGTADRDLYAVRTADNLLESDVTVLMAAVSATKPNAVGVVSRYASSTSTYRLRVRYSDNTMQLTRNGTEVGTFSLAPQPAAAWRIRLRTTVSGANALVRGRYWDDGATEPSTWHIEYTDTAPLAAGKTGLYADIGPTTVTVDVDDYVRDDLVAGTAHERTIMPLKSTHIG